MSKPKKRFASKYTIDPDTGCWQWTASITGSGYGKFWLENRIEMAHRASLILSGIKIPDGMVVCHSCDNKKCVNPDHLWIGTYAENSSDMVQKGRAAKGEKVASSKLKKTDVVTIRSSNDPVPVIMDKYGISRSHAYSIKQGKFWGHVN